MLLPPLIELHFYKIASGNYAGDVDFMKKLYKGMCKEDLPWIITSFHAIDAMHISFHDKAIGYLFPLETWWEKAGGSWWVSALLRQYKTKVLFNKAST